MEDQIDHGSSSSALALRKSISRFANPIASSSTQISRSPRISIPSHAEGRTFGITTPQLVAAKRKRVKTDDDGIPEKKSPRKRGYAGPEKYAHLKPLSGFLAPFLDVIFCGINPGCMSATKGHHFANPTNHFWKALHLSGFTSRLLSPSEDATLPELYSLGLTNLVARPSAEQAELSKDEMNEAVPILRETLARYRPRIVCFVGKCIWLVVESTFKKQMQREDNKTPKSSEGSGVKLKDDISASVISPKTHTSSTRPSKSFEWGLQPYKIVHSDVKQEDFKPEVRSPVTETLFFVMPSTSGRVVSHQLSDKVKLFERLRIDLEKCKSNSLDTSQMRAVPIS